MKKTLLAIISLSFVFALLGFNDGSVTFLLGDVKYLKKGNSSWEKLSLNKQVDVDGQIKTGPDAEVEITWKDKVVAKIGANKTIQLQSLYDDSHKKRGWMDNLSEKLTQLTVQNTKEATGVGGVRRDEVEVKTESELYWDAPIIVKIDDAIALLNSEKLDEAEQAFLTIIDQAPLAKDAETSRGYLVMIYKMKDDTQKMTEQIIKLKEDFPNSPLIQILEERK